MEINPNNIEEQILLYVDGELSTEEAAGLLQYIGLNPQWRTLLDDYQSLVMPQDDELVFEGKEALLQPEPQVIPFKPASKLTLVRRAAAVALFAGAAGLTWFLTRQDNGSILPAGTPVALVHQAATPATPAQGIPVTTTPVQPQPLRIAAVQPAVKPTVQTNAGRPVSPLNRQQAEVIDAIAAGSPTLLGEHPEKQLALELQRPEVLMEPARQETVAGSTTELPAWLPVNEQKLEGLNGLIAHIRDVKDSVAAKAAQLKKTTFVIRLGDKEIAFKK